MADIKRNAASQSAIAEAAAASFAAGYGFSESQVLIIKGAEYVQHLVDGVLSARAVPVITLEGTAEVIYLQSFLKTRMDYKNQPIKVEATFNKVVTDFSGKTVGELVEYLNNNFKGKKLVAHRVTYPGINRRGEVQPISFNTYDLG